MSQLEAPHALQFITNAFGDELLYEVNRNTFSRLGSNALYGHHFGTSLRAEDTLYLVTGTDSGLLPRWLLQEDLPPGSRYVFVELPELLDAITTQLPDLAKQDRIALVTPDQWSSLSQAFRFQNYAYLDQVRVIHSLGALDAHLPQYHELRYKVEQEVEQFTRSIKLSLGNHAFIRRQIENVADNLVPANALGRDFEGRTAVLLGGGPSLDDILPWVMANRDRLVVITVSRIARQLLTQGLQPDMVASVDPHPVSFDVSKEMLRFGENCLLIHAYHVSPLLLAQWRGHAVYSGARYPWETARNPDNLPTVGPTVSNTALASLVDMGFSQIVLGGVDLCFSREGHTHASGSNERKAGVSLGKVGLQVETNGGWLADTDHAFKLAVSNMGAQAKAAADRGCHIVNPALHAARMPSVEYAPLDQIELPDQPLRFTDYIASHLPSLDLDTRRSALREVKQELARANGRIRAIVTLTKDALACNRGLFGRSKKDADFKYKKRMDKIERKLDRDYKDLTPLVKTYGVSQFLRLSRPDREREWSDEELERFGEQYYHAYQTSAEQLLALIEAAQQRTDSRLAELDAHPAVQALVDQWQADQTPGRLRVWQAINPQAAAAVTDDATAATLQSLDEAFEAILDNQDTRQARQAKEAHGLGLEPVRSKLRVLFDTHDIGELNRLSEQLAGMDEQEAAELQALALGYLAELRDDPDAALGYFNAILEQAADKLASDGEAPQNPRLEDALRRMSYITLTGNDQQNALMVLDVLSAISPSYEPQYADLLRMTGNTAEAVSVYTDYMAKVPHDLGTLLKLGKLYQDIGQTESASWVYRHILEKDPSNSTASHLLDNLGKQITP